MEATEEDVKAFASESSAALTTSMLEQPTWKPPSARASEEYVPPKRHRDGELGKQVRNVRCTSGPIDGWSAITIDPKTVYEVRLDRGLGKVPQVVADAIQRDGGPWQLL